MSQLTSEKPRRWWLSPNFLAVAVTTVVAVVLTLAVSWYPVDETGISSTNDAPIGPAPITDVHANSTAVAEIEVGAAKTPRDDAPAIATKATSEVSDEWSMAAGRSIADETVRRAKDLSVADGALHGEVERQEKMACEANDGCDERRTALLKNSATHNIIAYLEAALNDKEANAVWVGRTLIASGQEHLALSVFDGQNLTGHARTLLVDSVNMGGDYTDKDGLAYLMIRFNNESPLTDSIVFGWAHKLRDLMEKMTPSEAADVRYALRGYIANLRVQQREQKEPNDAALFAGLIAELEVIERGDPQ